MESTKSSIQYLILRKLTIISLYNMKNTLKSTQSTDELEKLLAFKKTPSKLSTKSTSISQHLHSFGEIKIEFHSEKKIVISEKLTVESFYQKTMFLLNYIFKEDETGFVKRCMKLMEMDWNNLKDEVGNRLNRINYLEQTLKYKSYHQIEVQMKAEWKKNKLLHTMQLLWNDAFKQYGFNNIRQAQIYYECFKNFISQTLYLKFRGCLQLLEVKKHVPVLEMLYNETAINIITSSKSWRGIYQDKLTPLIIKNMPQFPQEYSFKGLKVPKNILDVDSEEKLFKNTSLSIKDFISQIVFSKKIQLLREYRANFLKEIEQNLENSIKKEGGKRVCAQKDDLLDCLIYILAKNNLNGIGLGLEYLNFLMGDKMQKILSEWQVDSYRTDLLVAFQCITQSEEQLLALEVDHQNIYELQKMISQIIC